MCDRQQQPALPVAGVVPGSQSASAIHDSASSDRGMSIESVFAFVNDSSHGAIGLNPEAMSKNV